MKTNLRQFAAKLIHQLNDRRIIIRNEVQHVIIMLSYVSRTPINETFKEHEPEKYALNVDQHFV